MKKNIRNIGLLVLTGVLISACSKKDDNTGDSIINYNPATVTLSSLSPNIFDESAIDEDNTATYQITIVATLDSPQPVDAVIDLAQVGGSASASDFDVSEAIRIKAGQTTASATVDILKTGARPRRFPRVMFANVDFSASPLGLCGPVNPHALAARRGR